MILLIDSAEALDQDLLRLLFDLGKSEFCHQEEAQYSFSLMLFMGMVPANIFTKKLLSEAKSYILPPMSATQIKRLIEHVYEFIGKEHDFSSSDISRLHGMSYGYPGRLLNLLNLKSNTSFLQNKYYLIGTFLLIIIAIFLTTQYLLSPNPQSDPVAEHPIVNTPAIAKNDAVNIEAPAVDVEENSVVPFDQNVMIPQIGDELVPESSEVPTIIDSREPLDAAEINHEAINAEAPIVDSDHNVVNDEPIMDNETFA